MGSQLMKQTHLHRLVQLFSTIYQTSLEANAALVVCWCVWVAGDVWVGGVRVVVLKRNTLFLGSIVGRADDHGIYLFIYSGFP